jgi:indolepyruvate ferredoxin oxidoreductase
VVITGIGGTGAVTVGATLAMAAHLDGKGVAMMEMAGLAQKGGAVHIHLRLANQPSDISAVRVATGEADTVVGGDLVTTAGAKTLGLMRRGRTGAVVNLHDTITGAFTRDRDFRLPNGELRLALEAKLKDRVAFFDASDLARVLMGDSIYSNMMVLGACWQNGLIPLTRDAIFRAIVLNGAEAEKNQRAFDLGRWAMLHPEAAARSTRSVVVEKPASLEARIALREAHLVAYQGPRLARRYRRLVDRFTDSRLREAVAAGYHKLLTYKDEYEVARLHRETMAKARAEFDGDLRLSYHLAPPLLPGRDAAGRPKKRAFGPWIERLWGPLAAMKVVRGTPFDPFGWTAERRMERRLIRDYEADMAALPAAPEPERRDAAVALAELPLQIRGFGPVKAASAEAAARRRAELRTALAAPVQALARAAE